MLTIKSLLHASAIVDAEIRRLVEQRLTDLGGLAFDASELGYFLVLEPGDTMESVNAQLGFDILANRFTGTRFDAPGFTPSFEFIEAFPVSYDLVFILDDSGFGVEIFVPITIDLPHLLQMCSLHASFAPT
ncbi:hypothetical protein HZ993_09295 [Rhodoferax sp. AJA081-3]|uniref:hypothetical protein n=1 Tax=Rhodoferax sp. AJA081-3 TaxID=2752316 RepID=UPI001AE047DE|nr:hypothetical protein [Rhodoferax sp. AJA081-3]QTN29975.1 hypothetical protein HZ993_09295 [Rhodoferax sp. AJA081-3]